MLLGNLARKIKRQLSKTVIKADGETAGCYENTDQILGLIVQEMLLKWRSFDHLT